MNSDFEKEQLELEKRHKKLFPDHHFKIDDQVTMINSNHQRFKTGILYRLLDNDDYIKTYNNYSNNLPKKLTITDIEYEDQFGMIIQRLYFYYYKEVDIDFRRSFFYDHCREEKIRRVLE